MKPAIPDTEIIMSVAPKEKSSLETLRDRVVDLVVELVNKEGGISQYDLAVIFGPPSESSVTYVLRAIPIKYSSCRVQRGEHLRVREILTDQVVNLVKEFVNREGGMSQWKLNAIFYEGMVAEALARIPLSFSPGS